MIGPCSLLSTTLLLVSLYPIPLQAGISLPSFGDSIYVAKGSDVTLPWTYDFGSKTVIITQWVFSNDGKFGEVLAYIVGSTVTVANSSLPNINVIQPATLVLKNVSLDYNGTYTLQLTVLGVSPPPSSDILVIVVVRPVANISCTTPVNVTEGENFSCICSGVNGNPPATAYWLKDNNLIPITEGYLSALLDIKNISKNDNGTYICRVQSGPLTDEQRVDIIVFVRPVANISCTTPVNVTEGENVSCICSGVNGNPPATAYWFKDNNPTPITVGYVNAPLDIKNISKNDNGTYTCRVQSGPLTDEQRVAITAFDKPVVDVTCNTSVSIKEGKNFSCTCSGNDGSPPPSVMWLRDNNKLTTVDNILTLRNISKLNNGTYVCRVQSGNLKKEKRVDVTVLYKPTMISFTSNATNDIAKLGDNVKLTCVATGGYPKSTYRIMLNGTNINAPTTTGVLIIEKADSDNIGIYTCFACNAAGPIEKSLVLNVTETGGGTPAPSTTSAPRTKPAPRNTPTRNTNASTEKSISDKNCGGTEWYIVVITLFCGIGIGIIFSFTVMWLYRRRKENRDHPKPSETRGAPETHDNPSVYQELDLQRMNKEDNYQSLRKTSRHVGHQEPTAEAAESSYQELDKVRGSNGDNNYQSLNRV